MKKGFTLIELLAVIVVLAIIALIATPAVMNTIENSRKKVAINSYENLKRSAEIYYYDNQMMGNIYQMNFKCENGKCRNGSEVLEINGQAPEDGLVIISEDGDIYLNSIVINGYLCKEANGEVDCNKSTKDTITQTTGPSTILGNVTNGAVSDYKIYGNSVVENETVNLFNADVAVNDGNINSYGDALNKNNDGSYTLEKLPQGYRFSKLVPMFIASGTTIAMSIDIVDDNTQYGGLGFQLLDKAENEVYVGTLTNNDLIVTVASDVYQIRFLIGSNELVGNYITFKNLQIEIGNKVTDYRPYDEEKYQDYLEKGLSKEIQSVGDLVVDTNNSNYGKYEIPLILRMKNLININDFYAGGRIAKAGYIEGTVFTSDSKNYYKTYNQKFSLNNGVINILGKNTAATPGKGSTAVGFLNIGTTEKWDAGATYYFSCDIDVISNYYNTDTSYFRVTIDGKSFSVKKNASTGRYEGQVTLASSIANISNRYVQFRVDGCELNISNILLSKSPNTTYRPYEAPIVYSIYLDEPLRCVGTVCDYIDFKKQQVVRNIGVNNNINSTVINEKLYVLDEPLIIPISLPTVSLVKGVNEIIVDTMLKPSKLTVYYYD